MNQAEENVVEEYVHKINAKSEKPGFLIAVAIIVFVLGIIALAATL